MMKNIEIVELEKKAEISLKLNKLDKFNIQNIVCAIILVFSSVFSYSGFAQIPEDTLAFGKCIEKNPRDYCDVRHSFNGRAGCYARNREIADAVDNKNSKLIGYRNDCVFVIEVAQLRHSDGSVAVRLTVQPGEIFAVSRRVRRDGSILVVCRSPLQPVYDPKDNQRSRCVKK